MQTRRLVAICFACAVVVLLLSACASRVSMIASVHVESDSTFVCDSVHSFATVALAESGTHQLEEGCLSEVRRILESKGLTYSEISPDVYFVALWDTTTTDEPHGSMEVSFQTPGRPVSWRSLWRSEEDVKRMILAGQEFILTYDEPEIHNHLLTTVSILAAELWNIAGDTAIVLRWEGDIACLGTEDDLEAVRCFAIDELLSEFPVKSILPETRRYKWPAKNPHKRKPARATGVHEERYDSWR